jgi:uncharacterized surface protein with fasciclin (FAS1) repeats
MNNRNWCLVATAAAVMAFAPSIARADNAVTSTTVTSTTTTETFTPITIPVIAPAPTGRNGEPIDYSLLLNRNFDYIDLNQAHLQGYSDHDIAVMAKIADKAGVPFHDVDQLAQAGLTFPAIADRYNLRFEDVEHAGDYRDKVEDYKVAYNNTGEQAFRNMVAASQEELVTTPAGVTTYTTETTETGQDIAGLIDHTPNLSTFSHVVHRARLESILRDPGPLTVFAPTNAAFDRLDQDQLKSLLRDRSQCAKLVNYSIIPQRIDSAAALAMTSPTSPATLEGDTLQITSLNGNVMVNGANVVTPNVYASNGIVHEIDAVILPPTGVNAITTTGVVVTPGAGPTNTTVSPNGTTTTVAPNSNTTVAPNGTTTTITPNSTTTVAPNGTTTVSPTTNP